MDKRNLHIPLPCSLGTRNNLHSKGHRPALVIRAPRLATLSRPGTSHQLQVSKEATIDHHRLHHRALAATQASSQVTVRLRLDTASKHTHHLLRDHNNSKDTATFVKFIASHAHFK